MYLKGCFSSCGDDQMMMKFQSGRERLLADGSEILSFMKGS